MELLIVRIFLVFLSTWSSSFTRQLRIPAPYLIGDIAHVSRALILFFPFNLLLQISLTLLKYSVANASFISFSLTLSNSEIPRYLYPSSSMCFIVSPEGSIIPLVLVFARTPLCIINIPNFFTPNSILMSSLNT